jgi:hypothetical protein
VPHEPRTNGRNIVKINVLDGAPTLLHRPADRDLPSGTPPDTGLVNGRAAEDFEQAALAAGILGDRARDGSVVAGLGGRR